MPKDGREGWHGWDDYAAFYDWENARTVGRRDIAFWQRLVEDHGGPVLELGCGSGRVLVPVARSGESVVGLDRSDNMLALAQRRVRRAKLGACVRLVRGDIRALPFSTQHRFSLVIAPYGVLQSLLRDRDLRRTLVSVRDALRPGGLFAVDLVPDLPGWEESERRVSLRGRRPGGQARITLIESVRQDRARGLTIFDQEFIERRGFDVGRAERDDATEPLRRHLVVGVEHPREEHHERDRRHQPRPPAAKAPGTETG